MLIDFKDDDFVEKIKKEEKSIIQFSASWCAPCRQLLPIMKKLSESDEFKDKIKFYYGDIDKDALNTATSAGVRGVPTVIIYNKGVEIGRTVGVTSEKHMKDFLSKHL